MNKQRKVLITITYNEMGVIIDTKAEEVAQSDLQLTCNQLATDCISRQEAIDAINELTRWYYDTYHETRPATDAVIGMLQDLPSYQLPSADPELKRCPLCDYWAQSKVNFCPNCGEEMRGDSDE